jgi:hypothetical protein
MMLALAGKVIVTQGAAGGTRGRKPRPAGRLPPGEEMAVGPMPVPQSKISP